MNQKKPFLTRRSFHQTVAASGLALLGQNRFVHADTASLNLRIISKTPQYYNGWPTLTRRLNGQLIVVWSGGREQHVCPFGRVEMMRSDDDGETWSWPRTILDGASDDRDAGITETANGTLLVTTFTSLAYEPGLRAAMKRTAKDPAAWPAEKLDRWNAVHHRITEKQRQAELGEWMIRSTDGGITWSERYPTIVNSPHGPTQLADGRLLYAGKQLWSKERKIGVSQSSDDGASWQWLSEIPARDGDSVQNYHELHAVETDNGKIIAHIRNHNANNKGETLQCESTDGGETWTTPHSIGVWGLPSFLTKLRDGRLLMSYGHRRQPFGNQARVSDDEGASWSPPVVISDDGANGDLGYPSTAQLGDGSLLSVWYEAVPGHPKAVLRQARWRLND
ncbi:putative secreted protein [Rhodopirellula maiorica SM1]|uniref:Putative secreted protein n=1 Tax=Rhodopirellula maiorica SM1 TaxID=1265738 RepID=M5RVK6_9BACT|nr:sialidase family protein [Rhodopirellula maiorica]EMI19427.1 putative secreted protein [Rhodopirellula maiorica SM1]